MTKNYKVNSDNNTIIFQGILESAYKQRKEDEKTKVVSVKNTLRVTPLDKGIFDEITAYKDSGGNYTPTWYKEKNHIMLRSIYDIPVKTPDGEKLSFDDFCERGLIKGASVKVKFAQKNGAIYPISMVVLEDGEEYNPFDDM